MENLLSIILFSAISITFLFLISKITGKKEIAQLNYIDFVFAISVGSIAADMATDLDDTPFYLYLVAMAIFFIFSIAITFFERKGILLKNLFKGKPLMIIYQGEIDYQNLKKSKLDLNDLIMMSRNLGYFDLNDIAYAVFETNGQLSILPKGNKRPLVAEDANIPLKQAQLANYLIIDGNISYSGLSEAQKTEEWLYKKLDITDKKQLKQILIATYNQESDSIDFTKKAE